MRHLGYTRNMSKREKTDMFKKKGFRSCAMAFLLLNYYFYFLFSVPYVVNQLNSYNMKYGLAAVSMVLFLWLIAKSLLKLRVTTPLFLNYRFIFCCILQCVLQFLQIWHSLGCHDRESGLSVFDLCPLFPNA